MKKVCIVGCNGGIGIEICNTLKKRNYYLIGIDKPNTDVNSAIDEFYSIDLNSNEEIISVCESIKKSEELWGIVFSAGIYPIVKFEEYSIELWNEVLNINLTSCFLISKILGFEIINGGRIIFISSGASFLGSKDIAYSVSKSGLTGLTKGLAKIFESKVLVNIINPGVIDTKMSARMDENRKLATLENTILKRIGKPNELTEAVLFLLSNENSYMTGASIDINGGLY